MLANLFRAIDSGVSVIEGIAFRLGRIPVANLPVCDLRREGEMRFSPATSGVGSRAWICEANDAGAFAWKDALGNMSGPASSVDGEVALFSGTSGKEIKRATGTGMVAATSGVYSVVTNTGSGNNVLATSPTIVTPTIASLTNAQHNHTSAAGGGVLGPAALGVIEMRLSSDYTASNVNTAQKVFNASTNGAATLAASTTYDMEAVYRIQTTGITSHAIGVGFGGTATLTSIGYMVATPLTPPATDIVAATNSRYTATAANTAISNAVATATFHVIHIKGTVRVNAGGTFIPQFTWSAAPGGTTIVLADSFITFTPLGSNTYTTSGGWS